jgi:hypothetical protein
VTTVRPDLDPAIDGVVVTAMAKHPPVRYASAGDLAKAFREAIDVAAPVEGAPAPDRPAAGTREGTSIGRIVSTMRAPRPLTPATVPSTRKRARRMWVAVPLLLLTAAGGVAAAVVTIAGGEKHAATPITSTAARPPPPPSTSRTAPPKPPNLEPVPTADRFEWPKATLLAELPRLRGTVISGESCCAGERNSVAWVSLVTRSEPRSVWREVTQRWLPLLDGASYALAPGEVRTDELEGAAVESCLAPHVPCSLWRRARKRYRLDATGSQTSLVDGAQVMVRSIRNGVPWVEKALAHGKQLDTLRHPYDGTVKLWRPPYTEIEVAIGSPEDERLAGDTSQREVDLVSLKRDSRGEVRPTYSPQDGRCFGPYVRDDGRPANLSLGPGQEYRDDFLECGDEAGRVPGPFSATGRLTFPRLNPLLPAGARVIGFTAEQAGIDRSSDESAHPGLTVSWSISFYGQPMNCQSGNTAYPLSPVKLTCSVRKRRGTVYEVDTRALVIRQVARNVTANGDLWAGLYRPTLELVVPRS